MANTERPCCSSTLIKTLQSIIYRKQLSKLEGIISKDDFDINRSFINLSDKGAGFGKYNVGDRFSVLHMCTYKRWHEGVSLLLDKGADVDALDYKTSCNREWAYTCLMHAALQGNIELLELFIKHKSNVNLTDPYTNNSALLLAVSNGNEQCIQLLLENGAKVNIISKDNIMPSTPLMLAMNEYMYPTDMPMEVLEMEIVDQETVDKFIEGSRLKQLRIISRLIAYGCDVDLFCGQKDTWSPLILSCCFSDPSATRLTEVLLDAGADVDLIVNNTRALEKAIQESAPDTVKLLIQYGACVNLPVLSTKSSTQKKYAKSLVELALSKKNFISAHYLIQGGSNVNTDIRIKIEKYFSEFIGEQDEDSRISVPNIDFGVTEAVTGNLLGYSGDGDMIRGDMNSGKFWKDSDSDSDQWPDDDNMLDGILNENNLSYNDLIMQIPHGLETDSESDSDDDNIIVITCDKVSDNSLDQRDALNELYTFLSEPMPLKMICRSYLRKISAMYKPNLVNDLPLPTQLKHYLLCKDM